MLSILNGVIVSSFIFVILFHVFFSFVTRYTALKTFFFDTLMSLVGSKSAKFLVFVLFVIFFVINLTGNIPLNSIPTLFYSQTLTVSLLFWVPIIICVYFTQIKDFIAHMLPYGSPLGLMLFLPLVEIFSQLIRPFTLMVRLSTNLSRGHIIMYMFSYFTLLSSLVSPFIYVVLVLLFVLELCISLLQAYIFVSLIVLYVNETLW